MQKRTDSTARNDYYLVRMDVTDSTVSSTMLNRCLSTETGVELSASTVRRRILRGALGSLGVVSLSSSSITLRPLGRFLPPGNHLPLSFVVFLYLFSLQVCN